MCCYSVSFLKGICVCIVSVLLNIPTLQIFYYMSMCVFVCVCGYVGGWVCDKGHWQASVYFMLGRNDVGSCWAWRVCRSMMALNCSPEVAQEMAVICSCKNLWRILIWSDKNIKARQTRMRAAAHGVSHEYKEESILVGCEDVNCCALPLSFLILL
jgi:hypothetical protein